MLGFQYAGCQSFGVVAGHNGYAHPGKDFAVVVDFIDDVDCGSGHGIARCEDGFVDVASVHAFSAVFG